MRMLSLVVLSALIAFAACGQSAPSFASRLDVLKENYRKALERAAAPVRTSYKQQLLALKDEFTRAGKLEDALAVDAELKAQFPEEAKPPLGTATPKDALAKLAVEDAALAPLRADESVFSDRDYRWKVVPEALQGFQFTRTKNHAGTVRFKVLSDGVVYLACTSRFTDSGQGGASEKDFTSQRELQSKGWHLMRNLELKQADHEYSWFIFTRNCKAGESFTYRTEKYVAPILLVKP